MTLAAPSLPILTCQLGSLLTALPASHYSIRVMKPFVILTLTDTTYKWAGSNDNIQAWRSNFNMNLLARDCYTCH